MKFKNFGLLILLGIAIFACKKDDVKVNFDAAQQAIEDDAALVKYLETHYLNAVDGGIWTIKNGETPLMSQVQVQNITKDDIDYKLYFLKQSEGVSFSPTRADSVLTTYSGMLLDSTVFDSSSNRLWLSLTNVIDGWSYGFVNFKGGTKVIRPDESFYYENYGKGILFIPSGLAYGNSFQSIIPQNSPLIFQITLRDVNKADHDNDTILSILEDRDGDGNVKNDDTDKDGIPNYLDADDDGDGRLTKNEDANGDGNLENDDTDNDGIPNYLDKDN
ncbi:FKBP-type peptidyl-prolyl cis-trans isomerase [Lutibacter sp.]|uniref:FKBP-type peptidyl-prolyl cis-trans isomerase n=1 Tax=Lutibacter sp. TaxID=1925666 RepID=UPI0027351B88|nr:FKBP-type peptidyl-prolyl cis-trans isomerase [Lutibacter sp.]MDP3313217.1 FKBP-type peptidyl-prolyl cis-trans isomerase [Lutibacter sp.]